MATTVVLMGVAGVGKTSVMRALAPRLLATTQEGDDLHPADNVEKMASGQPLTDDDRRPWLDAIAEWIGEQERAGRDAIISCSALKRAYRDRLREGHPSVWFAHLVAPRDVLAARLTTRRGHFMPASLLDSQLATLQPLEPDEPGASFATTAPAAEIAAAIAARLRAVGREPSIWTEVSGSEPVS